MRRTHAVCAAILLWPAVGLFAAAVPVTVSPGQADAVASVESRCPTFSWGEVPAAQGYELVVYRIDERGREARVVLEEHFAGGVFGWTPSLNRCLERGVRYAWTLRTVRENEPGEWSRPRLFQVEPGPSAAELREALAVVQEYMAQEATDASPGTEEHRSDYEGEQVVIRAQDLPAAPAETQLSVDGNVNALSFTGDGSNLVGVATDTELVAHGGEPDAHFDHADALSELNSQIGAALTDGPHSVDTTCNGLACDGTNFTNVQWNNLASRPSGLDDGDDDTTYGAGPGLALTGTIFSLASSPVLAPIGNTVSTVDSGGSGYISMTLGVDGLPVVSYSSDSLALRVAKCNDVACSGDDESVSTVSAEGWYTSITLGADGMPVISFAASAGLRVAKCNDMACSGGDEVISTVDGGVWAAWTSITLGMDGLPVISYQDQASEPYHLKVAKCNDAACSGGNETVSVVDSADWTGWYTSITLGAEGMPVISYGDSQADDLKVAKCNDAACSGGDEAISTVDSTGSVGQDSSITLGTDGLPVISYRAFSDADLKVAKCNDPACSGGDELVSTIAVDSSPGFAISSDTSITVGVDGLPIISYRATTAKELRVAKCNDPACSGGDETIWTVDSGGASSTSITLGVDGLPIVSYQDAGGVNVARCGSAFCVPYFRRR